MPAGDTELLDRIRERADSVEAHHPGCVVTVDLCDTWHDLVAASTVTAKGQFWPLLDEDRASTVIATRE